jgi:hypothetical protein
MKCIIYAALVASAAAFAPAPVAKTVTSLNAFESEQVCSGSFGWYNIVAKNAILIVRLLR